MKALTIFATFTALAAAASNAATVLIGGTTLNGDLNASTATAVGNFSETTNWTNLTAAQTAQATNTNLDVDGTRNAILSLDGLRFFGSDTGYSMSAGDVFDISYQWRDAFNWNDALDEVQVTLFTTADDTLTGAQTVLVSDLSGISTANNTYESVDNDAIYTAEAADAGRTLFVVFHGQPGAGSDTSGFARFDNFVLEVTPIPEPSTILLSALGFIALLRRRR